MRVLLYGAGQFGGAAAEAFAEYPHAFEDIAVVDSKVKSIQNLPSNVRCITEFTTEAPDVLVVVSSAVPRKARERLVAKLAPIEEFWRLERRCNMSMMKALLPWIDRANWKMLIVGTNPVHEWVNALHVIYPNRVIVGLGSAFDSRRIRFLAAAMCPDQEMEILSDLRIVGGHGCAIGVSAGRVPREVVKVAVWMSNMLSVALTDAPDGHAKLWWMNVAIRPLVRGIAGNKTLTHLIVPVTYSGVTAATGVNVEVEGLKLGVVHPTELTDEEREEYVKYLQRAREIGCELARQLSSA